MQKEKTVSVRIFSLNERQIITQYLDSGLNVTTQIVSGVCDIEDRPPSSGGKYATARDGFNDSGTGDWD